MNKTDWAEVVLSLVKAFFWIITCLAIYDLWAKVNLIAERCQ